MNDKLLKDIKAYCKLNNIDDIDGVINKMLKVGFDIEKYGPNLSINRPEKPKEVVKEKVVKPKVTKPKTIKEEKKIPDNKETNDDLYGE